MQDGSHETRRQGLIDPDDFEFTAILCAGREMFGLGLVDLAQCVPAAMEPIFCPSRVRSKSCRTSNGSELLSSF